MENWLPLIDSVMSRKGMDVSVISTVNLRAGWKLDTKSMNA